MKVIKVTLAFILALSLFVPTYADANEYEVKDANSGFSIYFDTFTKANEYYEDNLDNYGNLLLLKQDKVLDMEYGIVEFVGIDGMCQYHSTLRNTGDYIHASYGVDGAYLYTQGDKVYFVISGDRGYVNKNSVILHPYESLNVKTSLYSSIDGYLYHNIKNQLESNYYSSSLILDKSLDEMKDNSDYYSYDGHYFYDNFYEMIDDYKAENYEYAINEEPYYNYYQYLPHRSISNYDISDLEDYFYNTLGINGRLQHYCDLNFDNAADEVNRSQLYGNIPEFFNCQFIYGTNAMMLISSSIVESSYGKSLNSFIRNNLYINGAYEDDGETSIERYDSVADSIYAHAKYFISRLYSNYQKDNYAGTNFGNKLSGINIEYALDQYYGEKAASTYFKLDNALGRLDYNSLAIGIVSNTNSLVLYKDEDLENKLISLKNVHDLSFVVLEVNDSTYKIQIDPSHSSDYEYDFNDTYAYVDIDDVDIVLNLEKAHGYDFNKINYDFNGGSYHDNESLSIKTTNSVEPSITPYKEGYEFINYDSKIEDDGHINLVANYKRIDSISFEKLFEKQGDLLQYPNLTDAKIKVKYEDGSSAKVPVTTDMFGYYDAYSSEPQSITISYNGVYVGKEIQLDTDIYDNYDRVTEALKNADLHYVRDNMQEVNYPLQMSQIRNIDYVLKQENNRNYVIVDNTKAFDISISGLDLSLDDRKNFSLIEDTYYVIVNDVKNSNREIIDNVAKGYGFKDEIALNLSFKFNYQNITLRGPAIVQINVDNKKNDYIYSVYHLNENGDVIKCRTTQSNSYIQFVIEEDGDYVVLSMPSVNYYDIDDKIENLSYENMGIDNNRINLEFMLGLSLILFALAGIIVYYLLNDRKDRMWKDYKKSLQRVATVQEEKQKN